MNIPALAITVALAVFAAADEPPPDTAPVVSARPAPARENPPAEPLTLVGRGKDLAVIENGELEQLGEAPPILILPDVSQRAHESDKAGSDQTEGPPEKDTATKAHDNGDYLSDALDARRQRLGRKFVDTPPPARRKPSVPAKRAVAHPRR